MRHEHRRTSSAVLFCAGTMLLFGLLSSDLWRAAVGFPGIDFYQYWGVGKIQRYSEFRAGSPYQRTTEYTTGIRLLAEAQRSGPLMQAQNARQAVDITGSPFLYHAYTLLPEDYSYALLYARLLEMAGVFVVLFALFALRGYLGMAAPASLALMYGFDPLLIDIGVANVNGLQVLLTGSGCFLVSIALRRSMREQVVSSLLSALGTFLCIVSALLKPTTLLAAIFLAGALLMVNGRRGAAQVSAAVLAAIVLVAMSGNYFGSIAVWSEWLAEITAPDRLEYAAAQGNLSLITILSNALEMNRTVISTGFVLLVIASCWWAFAAHGRALLPERVMSAAADPFLLVTLGIAIMLLLSPLVWTHYLVLMLCPAVYLLIAPNVSTRTTVLAVTALLLAAGAGRHAYQNVGILTPAIVHALNVSALPTLWIACLSYLSQRSET